MAREFALYSRVMTAWRNASLWNSVLTATFLIPAAVIVVGLFNPFGLSFFDEAGSAADWFAAIGTWVIGAGAMKIAYDANAKLKHEREAEDLAKFEARQAALRLIGTEAMTAQVFERNLSSKFDDAGNVDFAQVRILFEIAQKKLGAIRWDNAQKTSLRLSEDALEAMVYTEHNILAVLDYCERFLSKYPADLTSYDPSNCQLMEWMRESASDLTETAKNLEKAIRRDLFGDEDDGSDDAHS
ncbi:hypothetical protein [Stenotrophomonas maltophilia]|uniref:hypothetical protein n=1 Tax=Stenotrophomonas maltophilia TaxID=40324 RepID=UPI0012DB20AE|nr:hypothetical protein [Stenotrophomonas maltophilia]